MQDTPDARNLLETARRTLLDTLLPDLPKERLYDALMVARCMEIGARALAAGDGPLRREFESLLALTGETPAGTSAPLDRAALEEALSARNRALCQAIRAGIYDSDRAAALRDHLVETALDKVRETNPKYLETLV